MDNTLRENRSRGTPLYPLQLYQMKDLCEPLFVPYHWHQEIEILFLLKGDLELTVDGQKHCCTAGDIFFIGQEKLHGMYTPDLNCSYNALVFPLEFLNFEMFDYCQTYYLNPLYKKNLDLPFRVPRTSRCYEEIWSELSAITELNTTRAPGFQLGTKAALLKMISLLVRDDLLRSSGEIFQNITDYKMKILKSILTYINQHYNEAMNLQDVATVFGFSPKYFSRYFKKNISKSFVEYLNFLRMGHAAEMLLNTDIPVMEVANAVGFNNFSYFIKRFREIHNCTPSEYRKLGSRFVLKDYTSHFILQEAENDTKQPERK